MPRPDHPDEHRALVAALRARDAAAALDLFSAHRRPAFDVLAVTHRSDPADGAPANTP
ncbi:hypothetical protein OG905_00880 [Streptomyces sp. NBC_00322]|uniref:hypothetical protein n=1 Tax=Streptomyces sp. NBC_00322 TaxID=2975712 RepID=UPI002E2E546E|nr:hypothetical protein [Streptomyces sp. NBC_00322]